MASKNEHLLAIALGKKGAPPPEPKDDDGLEYGADDDGDEDGKDGDDDADDYSDEDSIQCAHDLMDALDKGDAQGIVEAVRAIAGK